MSKFLQGESSDAFAWLNPASLEEDRRRLAATTMSRLCSWTSVGIASLAVLVGTGSVLYAQGRTVAEGRSMVSVYVKEVMSSVKSLVGR